MPVSAGTVNYGVMNTIRDDVKAMAEAYGYNLDFLKPYNVDCKQVLRNLVVPEIGKNIFEQICKEIL